MSAFLPVGLSVMSWSLGVEHFQPSLVISGELFISPPALISNVLSVFLMEHVTGQFRLLIFGAVWWMMVLWLSTLLSIFQGIPY